MDDTVEVPMADYFKAINRWVEFWDPYIKSPYYNDFHQFLGRDGIMAARYKANEGPFMIVSPDAARKISLLNGPHYYTTLKAYKAQQDD